MSVDVILMDLFILYFMNNVLLDILLMEVPDVKTTKKRVDLGRKKAWEKTQLSPFL